MYRAIKIAFLIGLGGIIWFPVHSYAQANLIANGDFESYKNCPLYPTDTFDIVADAIEWRRPTNGKSLYYNKCSPKYSGLSVPTNWVGTRSARSGNAYMGLCAYRDPIPGSDPGFKREYIQTSLTQRLKAGRKYYFEMYVSRADSGLLGYAVKNVGALFTTNPVGQNDSNEINLIPQVESTFYLTDRFNWTKISGSFIATGGEQYLTIGRFGPDIPDQIISINGSRAKAAYYYIDDVLLLDSCTDFDQTVEHILGADSSFCKYSPFSKTLNAANSKATQYSWKNGSLLPSITVTDTGKYWVRMSDGICINYDTISITSNIKPIVELGPDTTICFNRPVKLQPKSTKSFYAYNWYIFTSGINFSVGTGSSFTATTQDFFIVKATDFNCSGYDTILVFKSKMDTLILRPDTNLCRQAHFLLDATTARATRYKWNTGDTTPTIYTSSRDRYWVTVSDGLCSVRDTVNIGLLGPERPTKDTSACETNLLIISGDPHSSAYLWNTGAVTKDIAAYNNGYYTIKQTKGSCVTMDSIHVKIDKVPIVNLGNDTNVCVDPLYTLKAISPYAKRFIWSTGDSTSSIQLDKTGIYAVRTENDNCQSGDTIEIHTQLKVPFSFGEDVSDCFNNNIILTTSPYSIDSFAWSTGVPDSFLVVSQPGTYWLRTSKGYCTNIDSITFYAKPRPSVTLRNDTTVCKGVFVSIDAGNQQNRVEWNTGDTNHVLITQNPGLYRVKVVNDENCFSKDSFSLHNFPTPVVLKTKKGVVCSDSIFMLLAAPSFLSYTWNDGTAGSSYTAHKGGKYWVTILDSFGCAHADTVVLQNVARPTISVKPKIETCELAIPIETEETYPHYLWNYTDTSVVYSINRFGFVHLQVIDTNNCRNSTTIEVVNNCPSSVKIPNVFSPNGDGLNDEIIPEYIHITATDFKIFNRWGKLVFETSDTNQAWDGKDVPTGTYFYILQCKGNAGEQFVQNGTITLIR